MSRTILMLYRGREQSGESRLLWGSGTDLKILKTSAADSPPTVESLGPNQEGQIRTEQGTVTHFGKKERKAKRRKQLTARQRNEQDSHDQREASRKKT